MKELPKSPWRRRKRKAEYRSVCPRIWYLSPVLRVREPRDPYLKDFNPCPSLARLAFTLTSWQLHEQIRYGNSAVLTLASLSRFLLYSFATLTTLCCHIHYVTCIPLQKMWNVKSKLTPINVIGIVHTLYY